MVAARGTAHVSALDSFKAFDQRIRKRREPWDTVPQTSKLIFFGMVFCLFAGIGGLSQLQSGSSPKFWTSAIVTGIFAMGYAWAAVEGHWVFIVPLLAGQGVVSWQALSYVDRHSGPGAAIPQEFRAWLETTTAMATFFVAGAYALAMSFINREGKRFFETHVEVKLAGDIHKSLVAPIERSIGEYEFCGKSLASGVVGGDLVDLLERDGYWVAYVADVAGHGVSSGVLMAMIKSSSAMSMQFDPQANGLLAGLNEVLCSLKTGNMFATFGLLAWSAQHGLRYSLAGHLPILLNRDGEVKFLAAQNLPIGVFPDTSFESTAIEPSAGDLFAIITDGLTEVFDKQGRELGIDAIAEILRKTSGRPLDHIASAVFRQATEYGARSDDQSLLLVRKTR